MSMSPSAPATWSACKPRHRHQEFLAFLKQVSRAYPVGVLHPVMDNYTTHKRVEIRDWLMANPRIHMHFTPTSGSWLNLVEIWPGISDPPRLLRDLAQDRSLARLGPVSGTSHGHGHRLGQGPHTTIRAFIDGWNDRCHPFVWAQTAEQILKKAEVVAADGRVVTASDQENTDLFWALRGGGRRLWHRHQLRVRDAPATPMANLDLFFWRPQEAQEALRLARDLIPDLPEDMGGFVAGLIALPAPFVLAQHHGIPGFAVAMVNWDSAEEHAKVIAPLRDVKPLFELVTPIPHVALQQIFGQSAPRGILAYVKAIYLDALTDNVIDIMIEQLPAKASPGSFIPTFALGGAYVRVPEDQTAFGGSPQTRWALNVTAIATDRDAFAHDRTWVRGFWAELRPHANSSGSYINFR